MNVLVILCHPRTHSFNHALAARVLQVLGAIEHTVVFHDLYREGFDPVLEEAELRRKLSFDPAVLTHMEELERADALVVIHPDWWSQPPALLKGWIDRVLQIGGVFRYCGIRDSSCHILNGLRDLDRSARLQWLDRVENVLRRTLPVGG